MTKKKKRLAWILDILKSLLTFLVSMILLADLSNFKLSDWVMIAAGGTEFVFGAFLSWIGRGRRQFFLSGWLGVTAAASLMVLAFPYAESNPANVGE